MSLCVCVGVRRSEPERTPDKHYDTDDICVARARCSDCADAQNAQKQTKAIHARDLFKCMPAAVVAARNAQGTRTFSNAFLF